METCTGCKSTVSLEQTLKCTMCKNYFDYKCLNLSLDSFTKITTTLRQQWLCPSCLNVTRRRRGDNSNTPVRGNTEYLNESTMSCDESFHINYNPDMEIKTRAPTTTDASISLTQLSNLLDQKLDKIRDNFTHHIENTIKREINTVLQEWKCDLDKTFQSVQTQQKELENQITAASLKIKELESDRMKLEDELNTQAQSFLLNEVEISGMTEKFNENLFHSLC